MLRTTSAATLLLLLAGCVTQASLVSDGKRYPMQVSQAARKVSTNIDGVTYAGIYSIGASSAYGMAGTRPVFMATSGANAGQGMLTGANGDIINCDFMYSGSTVMGQCKGKNGRDYTLATE
jgi:hypothetical protein